MIALQAFFWVMVIFFALIGAMRGWSKEVIAMAGLILSLFAINTFGGTLVRLVSGVGSDGLPTDIVDQMRTQFYLLALIHVGIAFFSYQGVALVGGRLSGRERFQERLLGMIFGALNGYLIVGTLWSFLEYQSSSEGWLRLPENFPYAFDPIITRPDVLNNPGLELILTNLPLPFLAPWLPILVVVIFLFVIIVVI
ncbi:MAG: CvpA family protein [Candidatus Promineifilaceae bacterium]|nr:CvpA family protein [Candidatus Promineifilaceae bacterium]